MSNPENTIRVVIAEDHPVTRKGIRAILEEAPDIEVVGEAADGTEAQQMVAALQPHILLLDLVMPGPEPAEVEAWVRAHYPETVTLILTAHDLDRYLAQTLDAGAVGFLTKDQGAGVLIAAIRKAAQGEVLIAGGQLARAAGWRREVGSRWENLTPRERQVLTLLAEGAGTQQIAEAWAIEARTVETHIGNILSKLGVASRAQAVAWVWQHGMMEDR